MPSKPYKCVVIGDAYIGKTCMVMRLAGEVPNMVEGYDPTILDNKVVDVNYKGQRCQVELVDTAGQEEYSALRTASYIAVDAFLLCFSLAEPDSFANLKSTWLPELRRHQAKAHVILVGTKLDLDKQVSRHEIDSLRHSCGLYQYAECSSATGAGIQDVLDRTLAALHGDDVAAKGKRKRCSIL